jgi:sigma-E factor negative regulatory protein RseC
VKQAEQIEHKGVVALVGRNFVSVDIEVMEACGSCSSRKACAMGTSDKREIIIYTDNASAFRVGEVVNVAARQRVGMVAVLLCYILPLVVLIATLTIMVSLGCSEGLSALVTLCCTAAYYAVLALLHKHIAKRVVFTINKL